MDFRWSPTAIRLYACHMSSASSGTRTTDLTKVMSSITVKVYTKNTHLQSAIIIKVALK